MLGFSRSNVDILVVKSIVEIPIYVEGQNGMLSIWKTNRCVASIYSE
jgi:hypothetical protein